MTNSVLLNLCRNYITDGDFDTPIIIYCDGSCINNPGDGGWGSIVTLQFPILESQIKVVSGRVFNTTNNQMEIMAAIQGILTLNRKNISNFAVEF